MKKKFLSLILCGTLLFTSAILSACGKDDSKNDQKAASTGSKDVFTYSISGDTGNTLNPLTADDRYGLMTCHLIYSPAYRVKQDGNIEYILADKMEPSEDGKVYTMNLKKRFEVE